MNDDLKTSQNGLEFLAKWEGCILKPYKDIAGLRTIGIGHLIKPGENFPDGVAITHEKALEILSGDVSLCENAIKQNVPVALNQNQFDALVSFGFNCGTGVYSKSSVATCLKAGDLSSVPSKLLEWSKARINGVMQTNQGLYNRRKSEGELFLKPVGAEDDVVWNRSLLIDAQSRLKKLGLYQIAVDGIWGPSTESAVVQFAANNSIVLTSPAHGVPQVLIEALHQQTE
jgi:lysozyme